MVKPNLQKLLAKWQKKLRLKDWDIKISYQLIDVMKEDLGNCRFDPQDSSATICILWPQDEVELTLVHELVHIPFAQAANWIPYPHEGPAHILLENSIEKIAKALLSI